MKNPTEITIQTNDDQKHREDVATWWYNTESVLVVEYSSGETELFPDGNVVDS